VVIAEVDYIESTDFHVPVRVYADPGKVHKGKYALEMAVKTLNLYEEKFGVKFPLPKMDMVV
jgi:aminopeptidase N